MSALAKSSEAIADETHSAAAATNAEAGKPSPTLDVRGYRVEGNTVLDPKDFALLTNCTGDHVTFSQLREGLGKLQLRYRELGFPTISVTLPQQKLTNGIVRVKVVEGRLSKVVVEGNHFFSSNNVLRAVPSVTTNILLNTKWLQPELDRANGNPDRQIYPVIGPGFDPGTTELTLKVKDRLPLHGHVEINDKSTPLTPLLRMDTALQYNNLWQQNHQIGVEFNFSPQDLKPGDANPGFYDEPAVASYSGFYRIPIRFDESLRESYERLPVDFGYDQVTHRFNLPAPTGAPEIDFFASRSTSDTAYRLGPTNVITSSATLDVYRQVAERNPTINGDLGTKFIWPLPEWSGLQSSLSFGLDFKSYQSSSLVTSYTTVTSYSTDVPPVLLGSTTDTNYQNSGNSLYYFPLSIGWSGSRADKRGSWSAFYNQNIFLPSLQSARRDFQSVAGSASAGGTYTSMTAGVTRQENLPANWSVVANANGQWASEPLINNEQFALGGTSGVRGYREGETYGDTGWRAQFDLRAPPINIGYFPLANRDIPAELRCSWFMDYGESYRLISASPAIEQWGTGLGFYLNVSEHVDARLTLAWALHDTPVTPAGSAQAYFSVGVQF